MTSHEKDLYKRTLGIGAEESLPLHLVRLHDEAEHAWHGLGGSEMKPEMIVMIMLMAGVLRRNDENVLENNNDAVPTSPTQTEPNGPCVAVGRPSPSEASADGKDDIPLDSMVLVDGKEEARFVGWTEGGRMRLVYPTGSHRHVAKQRVTPKETVYG